MSDAFAEKVQQEQPAPPSPDGRSMTLSITLHPNGQVEFNMPMNFVLAHGLLGMASSKLALLQLVQEAKQQQPVKGGLEGLLKRMNGGSRS